MEQPTIENEESQQQQEQQEQQNVLPVLLEEQPVGVFLGDEETEQITVYFNSLKRRDKRLRLSFFFVSFLVTLPLVLILCLGQGVTSLFIITLLYVVVFFCNLRHFRTQRLNSVNELTSMIITRYFWRTSFRTFRENSSYLFSTIKFHTEAAYRKNNVELLIIALADIAARLDRGVAMPAIPENQVAPEVPAGMSASAWARCEIAKYETPLQDPNGIVALDEDQNCCAICLGEYMDGEQVVTLPCGHQFHLDCMAAWGKCQSRCPLCNQDPEKATKLNIHSMVNQTLNRITGSGSESPRSFYSRGKESLSRRPSQRDSEIIGTMSPKSPRFSYLAWDDRPNRSEREPQRNSVSATAHSQQNSDYSATVHVAL